MSAPAEGNLSAEVLVVDSKHNNHISPYTQDYTGVLELYMIMSSFAHLFLVYFIVYSLVLF